MDYKYVVKGVISYLLVTYCAIGMILNKIFYDEYDLEITYYVLLITIIFCVVFWLLNMIISCKFKNEEVPNFNIFQLKFAIPLIIIL